VELFAFYSSKNMIGYSLLFTGHILNSYSLITGLKVDSKTIPIPPGLQLERFLTFRNDAETVGLFSARDGARSMYYLLIIHILY
jgi:hypothetical protein